MRKIDNKKLCIHSMIIVVYVLLNFVFSAFGFGMIQVRVAEALMVFALYDKFAILSLTLACFISNYLFGNVLDAMLGTFSTCVALIISYKLRHQNYYVAMCPHIICNALIVPLILRYAYGFVSVPYILLVLSIAVGEAISIYVVGNVVNMIINRKMVKGIFYE